MRTITLALLHDADKLPDLSVQRAKELGIEPQALQLRDEDPVRGLLVAGGISLDDAERMAKGGAVRSAY